MHEQFLLAALEQAQLGRGLCAPNPSVGAVAVQDGQIIARSWHRGAGTPHAEQLLLEQLPKNLTDITLYVTLEPCNHWGRTPPCVDAIVAYGMKRVVYAYRDPNPLIAMKSTPGLLESHGIEVVYYPLPAIDVFYQSYAYWTKTQKPWVTVKMAHTFDGKIAGEQGARVSLSNALCATLTHQKRLYSDVILTTARTVNQDNPRLDVRLQDLNVAKPVAVLDSLRMVNQDAILFSTMKHGHIYYQKGVPGLEEQKNCSYHAMPFDEGGLDLAAVISHLGQLGYHDVWVEAGGILFSALHRLGLVNQTYLYLVPNTLGKNGISAYHHADLFKQASRVTWQPMGDNLVAILDWFSEEALCSPV